MKILTVVLGLFLIVAISAFGFGARDLKPEDPGNGDKVHDRLRSRDCEPAPDTDVPLKTILSVPANPPEPPANGKGDPDHLVVREQDRLQDGSCQEVVTTTAPPAMSTVPENGDKTKDQLQTMTKSKDGSCKDE